MTESFLIAVSQLCGLMACLLGVAGMLVISACLSKADSRLIRRLELIMKAVRVLVTVGLVALLLAVIAQFL